MKLEFSTLSTNILHPFGQIRPFKELYFGYFSQEERWKRVINNIDFNEVIHPLSYPKIECLDTFKYGQSSISFLKNPVEILSSLSDLIKIDFELLRNEKKHQPSNIHSHIYRAENIHFGKNVTIRNCTLNATHGPIIIGDDVEIMEYAVIYGPAVINSNSKIAPQTFIRANSVIGKNCYVGGEIKNSLILSNTNKGHYGYLGDSIIGEYCNLGAGTTTSNLKNNFSNVRVYSFEEECFIDSKTNKLGALIGDFSMTAVNTCFGAGTTIGVHCNVFGESKVSPKLIHDFSWGEKGKYKVNKWKETAHKLLLHKAAGQKEINNIIGKLETLYKKSITTH